MSDERAVNLAKELLLLGVSQAGATELMSYHPYDIIERQLLYLPYRNAKRPEAFIVEAVRNNYSPPKEFFHAQSEAKPSRSGRPVDKVAERAVRQAAAEAERHGTPSDLSAAPPIGGVAPAVVEDPNHLPNLDPPNGQAE